MTRPSNLTFALRPRKPGMQNVREAFLLELLIDFRLRPVSVRRYGKTYWCYYEHFSTDQELQAGVVNCIGSFQQWEDGNNYVVIRPLRERIKG